MRRFKGVTWLSLALLGGMTISSAARAQEKSPATLLEEIKAVKMPELTAEIRGSREKAMVFIRARQEAMTKKAGLIGSLYKADPNNAELAGLLPERWQMLMTTGPQGVNEAKAEIDSVIAKSDNAKLKLDAQYWKTVTFMRGDGNTDGALKAAEAFAKAAPKDDRGAMLLYSVANQLEDTKKQTEIYKRVAHDYPESQVAKMVAGNLKRIEAVGKPFDIEFSDAIKGTTVSTKTLKGKVVVVDFWATWCGPCVAEMPNMKKLYAEYKDKGVEFIGVSLDQPKEQGGLDKLKDFVAKNEIGWPQYYQGNGWQSEFSSSWGINSIPAVFIVDAEGKLFSVEARGKLETLIPELLKKAKTTAGAGAGGQ